MRVLVTGGCGFLGHAVVRALLDDGHQPVVMSSRGDAKPTEGAELVVADLRNLQQTNEAVSAATVDAVCHLAALTRVRDSFERPLDYFDVNTSGTMNLLRSLEGVPVAFASTGAVYGPCEGRIVEAQVPAPTNAYGASKLAAEAVLRFQAKTGRVGVTVLRCFNMSGAVDGVGDNDLSRVIPKSLAVAAGQAPCLQMNGDGSALREFSHVADVARALVIALGATKLGEFRLYNVGSGIECSMAEVVQTVHEVTDRDVPVEHRPPQPEPQVLSADSSALRRDLGWKPRYVNLRELIVDAWQVVNLPQVATSGA